MTWLAPLVWLGLAAVAVPVVVHLLAHRRAERMPFPTLRFLQPTRLAAIRRRALEDLALLAVRAAIIVAAVAAFAGPLLVTPARRASWNARLTRATIVAQGFSPAIAALKDCAAPDCEPAALTQVFETRALPEGVNRAVAWLESAPPGRREVVIAAPLTIGSLSSADLAVIPADVGVRFTRVGTFPPTRTVKAPPVLTSGNEVQRTMTLAGNETSVREDAAAARTSWPIEIVAPPNLKPTADAAMAAVLSFRIPVPPEDRRASLVLVDASAAVVPAEAAEIRVPWMADAVARIGRDAAVRAETARMAKGLSDDRFDRNPWHAIARALDGRPVASAAASAGGLVVATLAHDGDLIVPTLLRAIAWSLPPAADASDAEIVPIPESQLRAWTRQPGPPPPPRPESVERDDRRWLWGLVLVLLAVETWMRRSRADAPQAVEGSHVRVA